MRINEINFSRYNKYREQALTVAGDSFPTKTAKSDAAKMVGKAYEYLREVVSDLYLDRVRAEFPGTDEASWSSRAAELDKIDFPSNLSALRPKHFTPTFMELYSEYKPKFEELVDLYNKIKDTPVAEKKVVTAVDKAKTSLEKQVKNFDSAQFDKLYKEITEGFVEHDTQYIEGQADWALERVKALREFRANHPTSMDNDTYRKFKSLAGGDDWFALFTNNGGRTFVSDEEAREIGRANGRNTIEARNIAIAVKLTKEGVTQITNASATREEAGFVGFYKVDTAEGKKTVEIKVIYAGGYNIQCLHQRTLIKVR